MLIVAIVVQVLLVLVFLASGIPKLVGAKWSLVNRDRLRIAHWFWQVTGGLEVLGALGMLVGIFVPALAALAGLGFSLTMVGATASHLRVGDPFRRVLNPIVVLALAIVVVVVRWPALASLFG